MHQTLKMINKAFPFCVLLLLLLCLSQASAFAAARIIIVNGNAPGVGFNDPTPAQPVGGNPGTTIGQQRLIAFQFAADVWGATLDSSVEIRVLATFEPLTCTANSAVLGSAGTITVFRNFPGAEYGNTWYHGALADKRAAVDLDPAGNDIRARFNSNLGSTGCLEGGGFYYGLDGVAPTGRTALVVVLLHEFAHGLGFSTFVNNSTGAKFLGSDDVYMRNLFDNTIRKNWADMTNAERAASAINPRRVVWTGAQVTAAVPNVLRLGSPVLRVNSPSAIAGSYSVGTASFGAQLSTPGVTSNVVLVNDGVVATGGSVTDGCEPIANNVAGSIALIDRGVCGFAVKAKNAQNAGAVGVIIANNAAGFAPGLGGTDDTVTIPVISVSQTDGNVIKAQLANTVNATIGVDPNLRAGADTANRALIYTPNPLESGSSVSHYDTSASPNQLMEPAINSDLTLSVRPPQDLTLPLLRDEGWFADANGDNLQDDLDTNSRFRVSSTMTRDCQTGEYVANVTINNAGTGIANNVQLNIATLGNSNGATLPLLFGTIRAGESVTRTLRFPSSTGLPGARVQLNLIGTQTTTYLGGNFSATFTRILPACQQP